MFDGLFGSLNLGARHGVTVGSPVAGETVLLAKVNDPTFSAGLLGEGVAVEPTSDRVIAPADAEVQAIFPTGHAVALRTVEGVDLLIHVGLNTVQLGGRYFRVLASQGDRVSRGDVLIEFDRAAIVAAGYDIVVPVLVRNAVEFKSVRPCCGSRVGELGPLIEVRRR